MYTTSTLRNKTQSSNEVVTLRLPLSPFVCQAWFAVITQYLHLTRLQSTAVVESEVRDGNVMVRVIRRRFCRYPYHAQFSPTGNRRCCIRHEESTARGYHPAVKHADRGLSDGRRGRSNAVRSERKRERERETFIAPGPPYRRRGHV